MYRSIVFLVLISLCSPSFAQIDAIPKNLNRVTVHEVDHVAYIQLEDKAILLEKTCETCFFYWYKGGRIHQSQGTYEGKRLHGPYSELNKDMSLRTKGTFKHGLKDGAWQTWYPNGYRQSNLTWKNGRLHGPYSLYADSGLLKEKGMYRKGLLHGELRVIEKDSLVLKRYKLGKLITDAKPAPVKSGSDSLSKPQIYTNGD